MTMQNTYATVADFQRWEAAAIGMSVPDLMWAAADARSAADAVESHAPRQASRYRDEADVYDSESRNR